MTEIAEGRVCPRNCWRSGRDLVLGFAIDHMNAASGVDRLPGLACLFLSTAISSLTIPHRSRPRATYILRSATGLQLSAYGPPSATPAIQRPGDYGPENVASTSIAESTALERADASRGNAACGHLTGRTRQSVTLISGRTIFCQCRLRLLLPWLAAPRSLTPVTKAEHAPR